MRSLAFSLALVLLAALPAEAQDLAASPDAIATALDHVRTQASSTSLSARDVEDLGVSSSHQSRRSGLTYVYVQQRVGGIDVAEAIVTVAVGRDGKVAHAAGDLVAGAAAASAMANLPAEVAVARAASLLNLPTPSTTATAVSAKASRRTLFGTIAQIPVAAELVYVGSRDRGVRLAWGVRLPTADGQHVWQVRLDAQTGEELQRFDEVVHDHWGPAENAPRSFAPIQRVPRDARGTLAPLAASASRAGSYTVYAMPEESPTWITPFPTDGRTTVANPDDATASPFGWHDTNGSAGAEFTITRGNNVYAYTDIDGNNVPDASSSPDGGAGLVFDATLAPIDLANNASTYRPAAVVNLFYWNNIFHDVMYQYGFTEAAGNFQTNNYGRGGIAFDDAVYAEAQNSGNCNANFWTPADNGNDGGSGLGSRPRMQMYTCDPTTVGSPAGPITDSDLDNGVIVHEYGHGVSNRLTGGANAIACLQNAEQMGEGWSDFYGLMLTMEATDTRTTVRPIGNFLLGQDQSGEGIRGAGFQPSPGAPYSTDFGVNSATYAATNSGLSQPHGIGFVWATILWEATWDMIDAHGFDADLYDAAGTAGNQIMMNLVTEALKLQPCSPGFVDGRDAILAADAALYPDAGNPGQGLHYTTLWQAFARRGLGLSASQGSSASRSDQVEAFDTPLPDAEFSYAPGSITEELPTNDMTTEVVTISNDAAPGSNSLTWTAEESAGTPFGRGATATAGDVVTAEPLGSRGLTGGSRSLPATSSASVMPVDCTDGQTLDQLAATNAGSSDTGTFEWGQSFTAPCSGFLTIVSPVINRTGNETVTWSATMRVYDGAGTGGTVLNTTAFSYNNASGPSAAFLLNITLSTPVEIVEGQTYTWFMDMTGNNTGIQYSSANPYAGGQLYQTANGNPASATGFGCCDMQFRTTFTEPAPPPDVPWMSLSTSGGTLAPGASASLDVTLDATGLADGTYTAEILLTSNDPANATATIPVTLIVGSTTPGGGVVNGNPGWYLLGSPTPNTTVDQLASQNLVAGVPGFYPTFSGGPPGTPTVYTGYDGSAWTASTGTGEVIESGQGFLWYFWDATFTPTEPTTFASSAVPFPVSLTPPGAVNTADVDRTLHTDGNRINAMGNPFGDALDLTDIQNWPGGNKIASRGRAFIWDTDLNTWVFGAAAATADPWQGFAVRAKQSAAGQVLTIPASAAVPFGGTKAAPEIDRRRIELTLDGTEIGTGRAIGDRALEISFEDGARAGWDEADAEKFAPLSDSYVTVGVAADLDGEAVLKAGESRALQPETFSVPLAIEAVGAESSVTIGWPVLHDLPADWRVTLRDLVTGDEVDLRQADDYTFEVQPTARKASTGAPRLEDADAGAASVRFLLTVDTGATSSEVQAVTFALDTVVPNPVQGEGRVSFSLAEAGEATVAVFDVQGREVAVLAEGRREAGRHTVTWPTHSLAPGVYVVRLISGTEVATRRAVVVR